MIRPRLNAIGGLIAATIYTFSAKYPLVSGVFVSFGVTLAVLCVWDVLAGWARKDTSEGNDR